MALMGVMLRDSGQKEVLQDRGVNREGFFPSGAGPHVENP